MLISEASKGSGLTKKAIEYYIEQGLISPEFLSNGYRNFQDKDIEALKEISVYRRLGLSTEEIREVISDSSGDSLKRIALQKELKVQREQLKGTILEELSRGKSYKEVEARLKAIDEGAAVSERLLMKFPGYYGRFICLHFSRFLQDPISTEVQRAAYEEVIEFLDNVPDLEIPSDLQEFIIDSTDNFTMESINSMITETKKSIENPEEFLKDNKEVLEKYFHYKQSEEYKNSPVFKVEKFLKEFNSTSGYNDVFIPAMKRLSPSYDEYYRKLETANKKLLEAYPDIEKYMLREGEVK